MYSYAVSLLEYERSSSAIETRPLKVICEIKHGYYLWFQLLFHPTRVMATPLVDHTGLILELHKLNIMKF